MRFFDWLFNRDREEPFVTELPVTVLNRWFLYDTGIGKENELAEVIGLMRVSDEGDAKEREDSDKRVEQIAYLLPFVDHISNLTSEVVAESQKKLMLEDGVPDEQVEHDLNIVKSVYKAISISSMMASFSIANELGFIHTHPEVFLEDNEVDNEEDTYDF